MSQIKCLIVSDTHGYTWDFREALCRNRDAEIVFFLGDGIGDAEELAGSDLGLGRQWLAVRGNCDFDRPFLARLVPKTDSITLLGKKIVFTHGDLYGVKYHKAGLFRLAKEEGADIVLYGHTHLADELYRDGIYFVNPGSLGGGRNSGCAVMTITESGVLFSRLEL